MNLRCLLWWRRKRSVRSDDCGADLHSLALLSPKEQPRRRRWHPIQCSCLENPRDRGACWAAVHEVAKSRTRLSGFTFTFHFHAPEKEMAPHSSVLAWRIPGMGEPGGLPSMGSHRVGHDWSDLAAAARSSLDFTGVSAAKDLPAKQETCVWALDQEDLLREGNGNPLQYSCLGNAMDRGARRVTVHGAQRVYRPPALTGSVRPGPWGHPALGRKAGDEEEEQRVPCVLCRLPRVSMSVSFLQNDIRSSFCSRVPSIG